MEKRYEEGLNNDEINRAKKWSCVVAAFIILITSVIIVLIFVVANQSHIKKWGE